LTSATTTLFLQLLQACASDVFEIFVGHGEVLCDWVYEGREVVVRGLSVGECGFGELGRFVYDARGKSLEVRCEGQGFDSSN
jgi:hypothetical protein